MLEADRRGGHLHDFCAFCRRTPPRCGGATHRHEAPPRSWRCTRHLHKVPFASVRHKYVCVTRAKHARCLFEQQKIDAWRWPHPPRTPVAANRRLRAARARGAAKKCLTVSPHPLDSIEAPTRPSNVETQGRDRFCVRHLDGRFPAHDFRLQSKRYPNERAAPQHHRGNPSPTPAAPAGLGAATWRGNVCSPVA